MDINSKMSLLAKLVIRMCDILHAYAASEHGFKFAKMSSLVRLPVGWTHIAWSIVFCARNTQCVIPPSLQGLFWECLQHIATNAHAIPTPPAMSSPLPMDSDMPHDADGAHRYLTACLAHVAYHAEHCAALSTTEFELMFGVLFARLQSEWGSRTSSQSGTTTLAPRSDVGVLFESVAGAVLARAVASCSEPQFVAMLVFVRTELTATSAQIFQVPLPCLYPIACLPEHVRFART